MLDLAGLDQSNHPLWDSRRPWSLWDMINFTLRPFVAMLDVIRQEIGVGLVRMKADPKAVLNDADKERVLENFKFIVEECRRLFLERAEDRLGRIADLHKLPGPIPWAALANEFDVLMEAIEDDIRYECFFHYRRAKSTILLRVPGDWANTFKGFPSAQYDIEQGVDCYACEHNTAAVFHFMRVAEHGLRALARERKVKLPRGRKIEWEDWSGVLVGIRKKVDQLANRPRGPARDAALEFYRGALGEFEAFKDAYRNNVMHARKSYDELEALGAMTHVRGFMERLASRIDENPKKQIAWGIR